MEAQSIFMCLLLRNLDVGLGFDEPGYFWRLEGRTLKTRDLNIIFHQIYPRYSAYFQAYVRAQRNSYTQITWRLFIYSFSSSYTHYHPILLTSSSFIITLFLRIPSHSVPLCNLSHDLSILASYLNNSSKTLHLFVVHLTTAIFYYLYCWVSTRSALLWGCNGTGYISLTIQHTTRYTMQLLQIRPRNNRVKGFSGRRCIVAGVWCASVTKNREASMPLLSTFYKILHVGV